MINTDNGDRFLYFLYFSGIEHRVIQLYDVVRQGTENLVNNRSE